MRLKAPEIEVPSDNPYANDKLGRRESVDVVSNIIRSSEEPLVLALNAPWGHGKTTFLRMLREDLRANEIKSVYFNAWESDYIEDPFVALLGDTDQQLKSLHSTHTASLTQHLATAKKLGGKIIRAAIPVAVKLGTAGLLDLNDLTEEALSEAAEKFSADQIDAYVEAKTSVNSFKEEIGNIAKSLYGEESNAPLIFIVDELDRCRPTHAVRLLEIIKHFFSIDRVVFVIALDPEQLAHSIRVLYGNEMDVDGYLKRFFDLELNLPKPNAEQFLDSQFERFGLNDFFEARNQHPETRYDLDRLRSMFKHLFEGLNFSYRERERAFSLLALAVRSTPHNHHLHPLMLANLIILKIKNPRLYKNFIAKRAHAKDVLEYFSESREGRELTSSNYGYALEAELLGAQLEAHEQDDLYTQFVADSQDPELSSEARNRAEIITHVLRDKRFNMRYSNISSVASKIDLISGEG